MSGDDPFEANKKARRKYPGNQVREGKMLALRGICEGGKIELLDPVPKDLRSLVAVVFLDVEQEQVEEAREAMLLARSPAFGRLVEHGLAEVKRGNTRPVRELFDELPD